MTGIPRDRWASRVFPPAIDRLLARCEERAGCWQYLGPVGSSGGYARLRAPRSGKVAGHRLTYEFFIGAIPNGLTFDHLCGNTSCVNPWHGDLVPLSVNVARQTRGAAADNRRKTHCPQGHSYAGGNLKVGAKGGRWCRACANAHNRAYRRRQKEGVK